MLYSCTHMATVGFKGLTVKLCASDNDTGVMADTNMTTAFITPSKNFTYKKTTAVNTYGMHAKNNIVYNSFNICTKHRTNTPDLELHKLKTQKVADTTADKMCDMCDKMKSQQQNVN